MPGEGGLISYCLIQIYTLLLGCQPKSWRTVFSGPEWELAILNPQLNIEQHVEFLLPDLTATSERQLKPGPQKKHGKEKKEREEAAASPLGV